MLAWPSFHDALDLPLFAWRSQPGTELRQSKAWNVIDHDTGLNPANKKIIQRAIEKNSLHFVSILSWDLEAVYLLKEECYTT